MNYAAQIKRIKTKLLIAKKADKEFKVFGSRSHKYTHRTIASYDEIVAFETKYNVTLPECYKSFMLNIGSGVGPYYGVWDLGSAIHSLIENPKDYFSVENKCMNLANYDEWFKVIEKIEEDDEISDEEYDQELNEIFAGILPIGTAGCTSVIGLILVGKDKGKVAHLTTDLHMPSITYEDNFLDWYERWLDEIISGKLIKNGGSNFDGIMGGGETKLFKSLKNENRDDKKIKILLGIFELDSISEKNIKNIKILISHKNQKIKKNALQILAKFYYSFVASTLNNMLEGNNEDELLICVEALSNTSNVDGIDEKNIEKLIFHPNVKIKRLALILLVKFHYALAKKHMINILKSSDEEDCLMVCDTINLHDKNNINYWAKPLMNRLTKDDNKEELIWSIMGVVSQSDYNYLDELSPLCFNEVDDVRRYSYYFLGKLNDKSSLESLFKQRLKEEKHSYCMVDLLQAIGDLNNETFIPYYEDVLKRMSNEQYISSNVNGLMSKMDIK